MKQWYIKMFFGILISCIAYFIFVNQHFTYSSIARLNYFKTGALRHKEDEERLSFNKQNVNETLGNARKLLNPYHAAIKKAVMEFGSKTQNWTNHGKTKLFLDAFSKHYFDEVHKLPSVRTIFAKTDFKTLSQVFNVTSYHYGSSNCTELERRGIYGRNWGKVAFNDTCQSSLSAYRHSTPVQNNYFSIGLPDKFFLNHTEIYITYMHVIANAVVHGDGEVFVDQTKLVTQRCSRSRSKKGLPNQDSLKVYDKVFTISQFWGSGFFHFTTENLIRMGPYINFLKDNEHIKVHVKNIGGFTRQWLSILGIDRERLISNSVGASILYMPAGGTCGRPAYFPANMLSINLRKSFGLTTGPRNTVVVIKRSRRRYFRNHGKIWQMVKDVAEPLGFQVKLFSDKPFPSQDEMKEMFQRAVLIVGPHGAGLSNMFLSQPGTVIIEGLCSTVNLCYRNLAKVLGHRYFGLLLKKSCLDLTPDDIEPYLEYFLRNIKND